MRADAPGKSPEVVLDLPGLECPMPVLKAKKALSGMAPGALLEVRSTDPHSHPDLAEFCRQTGHVLLSQTTSGSGNEAVWISQIERKPE